MKCDKISGKMLIHTDELSLRWIDRLASAGIRRLGIHPPGGPLAVRTLNELLLALQSEEYRALIDAARARGLSVEYELHAGGYLLPRELFAEHPDYFRMNAEGARVNDYNFCVSNPEAMALFARRAGELAESLYGSAPRFFFWMDDGKDLHCRCPQCRALSPSDQQLMAVNAMAQEIRRRIPNAEVAYLAYYDALEPPRRVLPEAGVFLEYAPYEKYNSKGRPDGEARIAHEREVLSSLMEMFGKENAVLLEYWYDNSFFSRYKKPPKHFTPDAECIAREVAEYRACGFSEIATFACFLGADYEALHGDVDVLPFARALDLE